MISGRKITSEKVTYFVLIEPLSSPDWPLSSLEAIKLTEKKKERMMFSKKK